MIQNTIQCLSSEIFRVVFISTPYFFIINQSFEGPYRSRGKNRRLEITDFVCLWVLSFWQKTLVAFLIELLECFLFISTVSIMLISSRFIVQLMCRWERMYQPIGSISNWLTPSYIIETGLSILVGLMDWCSTWINGEYFIKHKPDSHLIFIPRRDS